VIHRPANVQLISANAENSKCFLAEAIPNPPTSSHAKMTSRKEAMDVDPSTSQPSTSSDLMKLIDNANRVTTVPETEKWTIRGWPKGLAMFHKNNCQCCNE
jgi:hypothetical protein